MKLHCCVEEVIHFVATLEFILLAEYFLFTFSAIRTLTLKKNS